jgi:hypothetical protein
MCSTEGINRQVMDAASAAEFASFFVVITLVSVTTMVSMSYTIRYLR